MADTPAPGQAGRGETAAYPDDTVSLRELYLVWRRGLGLIVTIAVLCALAALAFKMLQGRTYTAEAVVQVVKPRVSNEPGSGLEVSVASVVDAGTYEAVAESPLTLEMTSAALDGSDSEGLGLMGLVRGPGPATGDAITITHRVTVDADTGPQAAADVANAWADSTVNAVRELVSAPLAQAGDRVAADVAARELAYQKASEEWAEFVGVDERDEIRRRLDGLVELDRERLTRLGEVEAELAATNARLTAGVEGSTSVGLRSDVVALEATAAHLRSELAASAGRGDELRARLADLESRAVQLQRQVSAASLSYFRAAPAATEIALQRELAAASVGLAIPASPPLKADDRNLAATVIGAGLVGGLLCTLLVFLRAAVREPDPG